jgi:hypothetical protein
MPIRSNNNLESYYDRFIKSGAGGPPEVVTPPWKGSRGIIQGGYGSSPSNVIQYITIANTGNATDFGDLTQASDHGTGGSNGSRGLSMGGRVGGNTRSNNVEYITFASTGNATDWGDLYEGAWLGNYGGIGNGTRAVMVGNYSPATDMIQYCNVATTGSAGDAGNLLGNKTDTAGCSGNNDRGICCAGFPSSNVIEYWNISTSANAQDFGDYSDSSWGGAGCDNGTRGWFCGNRQANGTRMEYVTIDTTGNSTDAGDLTQNFEYCSGFADLELGRGIVASSYSSPFDAINYWDCASTANAADFGDLLSNEVKYSTAGTSGT